MHIYVITDPIYFSHNRHKIGVTSHTREQLVRDYLRYIPEVDIRLFLPCPEAVKVETRLKHLLKDFTITNRNGNPSEWVSYELGSLLRLVKREVKREKCGEKLEEKSGVALNLTQLRAIYKKLGGSKSLRTRHTLTRGILSLAKDKTPQQLRFLPPSLKILL